MMPNEKMTPAEKATWILKHGKGQRKEPLTITKISQTLGTTRPTVYKMMEDPERLNDQDIAKLGELYDNLIENNLDYMLQLSDDDNEAFEQIQRECIKAIELGRDLTETTMASQVVLTNLMLELQKPNSSLLQLMIQKSANL